MKTNSGANPGEDSPEVSSDWTCSQFALTLGEDEVPEVLRRVADIAEKIDGFRLLNIVVNVCEDEATASVYYRTELQHE